MKQGKLTLKGRSKSFDCTHSLETQNASRSFSCLLHSLGQKYLEQSLFAKHTEWHPSPSESRTDWCFIDLAHCLVFEDLIQMSCSESESLFC
jgi:hypothetical protein